MDEINFNTKFVKTIKKHNEVYDICLVNYSNRDKVDAAWESIAKEVNATVSECKERWKNIRACYTRHLKHNSDRCGSSTKKHRKPYYLADQLQFVLPFIKSRSRESVDHHESEDSESIFTNSEELGLEGIVEVSEMCTSKDDEEKFQNYKFEKPIIKDISTQVSNESFPNFYESNSFLSSQEDPDLNFFKSLLPDVRAMNPDQKRRMKIGALQLIGSILSENTCISLSSPSSIHS